jgi:hypothetical protein
MSVVRFIRARSIAAPHWRVVVVVDGFAVSYCRLKQLLTCGYYRRAACYLM